MVQLLVKTFGPITVEVDESAADITVQVSGQVSLGGGANAGAISAVESLKIVVKGQAEVDALLLWAEKKWPAEAAIFVTIQAFLDPVLAKL
jgi:hypothetical protein